ncbi:MAG: hypothetical protein ACJ783_01325, partial [Myxococcales bacterium]
QVLARRLLADGDRPKVVVPELTLDGKSTVKPATDKRSAAPRRGRAPQTSRPAESGTILGALVPVAAAGSPR